MPLAQVWRVFRVLRGQRGRAGWVFPLHRRFGCGWAGSGDGGFVPVAGVGSDSGEGSGLEGGASGGEVYAAAVAGELDLSDAVEFSQCSGGAEVLVVEVGVADVGFGEVTADEGLDDGGVDANTMHPAWCVGSMERTDYFCGSSTLSGTLCRWSSTSGTRERLP